MRDLAGLDPRVTVVLLRRNFGQTAALAAGFAHSTGDYVIAMDGDLQHAPAEIPAFLSKTEGGYDIVFSDGWKCHCSFALGDLLSGFESRSDICSSQFRD
jgi:glycosyltransferase involved in cell wall biosynthesis